MTDASIQELTTTRETSPLVAKMKEVHDWTMGHLSKIGVVEEHTNVVRREAHLTSTQPDFPNIDLVHTTYPPTGDEATIIEWARPVLNGIGREVQALRFWQQPGKPPIVEYRVHGALGTHARSKWFNFDNPADPELGLEQTTFISNLVDESLQTLRKQIPDT